MMRSVARAFSPLRRTALVGGGLLAATAGWLIGTNPKSPDYERHMTDRLAVHLKSETCRQAYQVAAGVPPAIATWGCRWLVDLGQPGLQLALRQTTVRHNYGLFSLYRTQIGPQTTWPNYRQTTLGVSGYFIRLRGGWYLGDRPISRSPQDSDR